jgi:hypothetical protein
LKALRAVLGTMSQAASKSDAAFIVLEQENSDWMTFGLDRNQTKLT